jgi:pimeloyl-ACP methyl ester carboxylesterase
VKASTDWLQETGAEFSPGAGIHGCAQLTHYTVEYREWGEGPPLVLVPGLAGGFELLGPLAKKLAQNYRVISYQLRGEDNCFALRRPFDLTDLVEDLREFLDWLCLESPTVMGVSFGGILALQFAATYPGRLQNLIVQGAGARFEPGLLPQVAKAVLTRFPLPNDNPFINQFFNLLFGGARKQDALFHFVTQQCWQTDQSVMAHRLLLVEAYNLDQRLQDIRVPSLILGGEKDVLVSRRSLHDLTQGIPNARLVRLPGCGHLAFVTQPALVDNLVHRFIQESNEEVLVS